jgi:hypothetical protein
MDMVQQLGVIVLCNAYDSDAVRYLDQAFLMIGRALTQAEIEPIRAPEVDESWRAYEGIYISPWWGPAHVMILRDGLAVVDASEDDPWEERFRLEPTRTPHTFRIIEPDGIESGMLQFRFDASGQVTGLVIPGEELSRAR